jgi:multidrug resistance efflux pump
MTNLPRLFTDKGELITGIDPSKFDAPTRARYDAIVAAYRADKGVADALDAGHAEINAAQEAVTNTEAYEAAHWPKQTQHDLWKENFAGGPRNRMTARGLI